jgi:elongation factor P hydroxylase
MGKREVCVEVDCRKCLEQFGYSIMWYCPKGKVRAAERE